MSVYIVKHDVYGYQDDSHESYVEVFDLKESAENYFKMKKEMIIDDYIDYTDARDYDDLLVNWVDYDFEPTTGHLPYMWIHQEDFGFDRVVVQEKNIMNFN